jgi:hypothetical protein
MSALPSIADIRQRIEHVRFVPIADRSLVYDPLADEGSLFAQHRCELIRDAAQGLTIRAAGSKPVVAGNSPESVVIGTAKRACGPSALLGSVARSSLSSSSSSS